MLCFAGFAILLVTMDEFFIECGKKLAENTKAHPNGQCLIWTGYVSKAGYGRFRYRDPRDHCAAADHKTCTAHRIAVMVNLKNLDISANVQASHLCNNKLCVNIEHLVLESSSVNCQRRTCFRICRCNRHFDSCGNLLPDCLVNLSD